MGYQENFTAEEITELLADDLSLAASLATLILENGDINAFLVTKLRERAEEADKFHLSQAPRWMNDRELKVSSGLQTH
jgi:hypothetical protein